MNRAASDTARASRVSCGRRQEKDVSISGQHSSLVPLGALYRKNSFVRDDAQQFPQEKDTFRAFCSIEIAGFIFLEEHSSFGGRFSQGEKGLGEEIGYSSLRERSKINLFHLPHFRWGAN